MIGRMDRYFRTGEWQPLNFNDIKREQTTIAGLEEEIRQLSEQLKKLKQNMIYFYLRTKDGAAAFRRKKNCDIYSNNAGRWWFKYRDEPTFELPPGIIDKYHNNVLSIRDVKEYWVKHRA